MKTLIRTCFTAGSVILFVSCGIFSKNNSAVPASSKNESSYPTTRKSNTNEAIPGMIRSRAGMAVTYIEQKGFSTDYCFLVDMSIPSGKNRFFVFDIRNKRIVMTGLVAHGTCNTRFIANAQFSNVPGCGCSSAGKYKIGVSYRGKYGKSYRLHGLESSNSNAYKRAIVLHGFAAVPDEEIYPRVLCNSLGCPMVSGSFFNKLATIIDRSEKPILLWIYK